MLNNFQLAVIIILIFSLYEIIKRLLSPKPFKEKLKYKFSPIKRQLKKIFGRDNKFIIESTPINTNTLYPEAIKPEIVQFYPLKEKDNYLTVFLTKIYSWYEKTINIINIDVTYRLNLKKEESINQKQLSVIPLSHFMNEDDYLMSKRIRARYNPRHKHWRKGKPLYMGREHDRYENQRIYNMYRPPNLREYIKSAVYYKSWEYYRVEFILNNVKYNLLCEDNDYRYYYKTINLIINYRKDGNDEIKCDKLKGCIYYREKISIKPEINDK